MKCLIKIYVWWSETNRFNCKLIVKWSSFSRYLHAHFMYIVSRTLVVCFFSIFDVHWLRFFLFLLFPFPLMMMMFWPCTCSCFILVTNAISLPCERPLKKKRESKRKKNNNRLFFYITTYVWDGQQGLFLSLLLLIAVHPAEMMDDKVLLLFSLDEDKDV